MDQFTANPVRIGVVQTGSVPGSPEQNLQILRQFAQQAKEAGCSAVCFPEGFLTGYDPGHAQEYAIPQDDPAEDFGGKPTLLFFDVGPALLQRYRSEDPSMKYRYFPAKRRPELYTDTL